MNQSRPDGLPLWQEPPPEASFQLRLIDAGTRFKVRLDVNGGWLSLTALLVPRAWRQALRVGAAVAAGALGVVLVAWVVRFTWTDPVPYALLSGCLLAFIALAALAARRARVETVRLAATSLSNVWVEHQSFPTQRVIVNLVGPVSGDWSPDGRLRLVCESEGEADRLVAALQAAARGRL